MTGDRGCAWSHRVKGIRTPEFQECFWNGPCWGLQRAIWRVMHDRVGDEARLVGWCPATMTRAQCAPPPTLSTHHTTLYRSYCGPDCSIPIHLLHTLCSLPHSVKSFKADAIQLSLPLVAAPDCWVDVGAGRMLTINVVPKQASAVPRVERVSSACTRQEICP